MEKRKRRLGQEHGVIFLLRLGVCLVKLLLLPVCGHPGGGAGGEEAALFAAEFRNAKHGKCCFYAAYPIFFTRSGRCFARVSAGCGFAFGYAD